MAFIKNAILLCISIMCANAQSENSEKSESCNVVCNCNGGPPADPLPQRSTLQGPPGKLGPRGPVGAKGTMGVMGGKGSKGEIGSIGFKGEKGDAGNVGLVGAKGETGEKGQKGDAAISLSSILGALSATSCRELKLKFGLNVSGYYPMRTSKSAIKSYYCDFTTYPEISSCDDLVTQFNLTYSGYYLYGSNVASTSFQFCQVIFEDIYTCQDMRDKYPNVEFSGYYQFRTAGQQSFQMFCDFTQTSVVTEVYHNLMEETFIQSTCEPDGCYGTSPSYEIAQSDLVKIVDNSVSCKQFIKLKCQGVYIKNGNADHAWWVSRSGEKMTYWGGAHNSRYCACGETGTCIDTSYKCNCDQNSNSVKTSDEGYLTDKTKLPIKEVRIGDMRGSEELAWLTVGKLECSGQI